MAYTYPVAVIGDKYLLTFVGELHGQTIMNTWWYKLKTMVGAPTKGAVALDLAVRVSAAGQMRDAFLGACPGGYTLNEIWSQPIYPTRFAKQILTPALAGTSTFASEAQNLAAVITRRGVPAARWAISSLHVPSPTVAAWVLSGSLTAAAKAVLTTLATFCSDPVTTLAGHVLTPVIPRGPAAGDGVDIEQAFVQTSVRVMRRRTKGLGI